MTQRVFAITNGCLENRIDTASMQSLLVAHGWEAAGSVREASHVLVNVCGLTNRQEEKSLKLIKRLQARKDPKARLIVCGCLPRINPPGLSQVYAGPTFGSDDMEGLCRVVGINNGHAKGWANYLQPNRAEASGIRLTEIKGTGTGKFRDPCAYVKRLSRPYFRYLENRSHRMTEKDYYIKISTGCLNACSYCAVKLSRGEVRSKPVAAILAEFKKGLRLGYEEFALLGTDLGSYGRDLGINLATLLNELIKIDGGYKIKLRNVNPRFLKEMLPELDQSFASGKIVHLSSAAQSGSNRILRRMQRGYFTEEYQDTMGHVQRHFPHIHLRTQIMVGFPGETDADFTSTLDLLDAIFFNSIELYKYSQRPQTAAAKLEDLVPAHIIDKRYNRLYVKSLVNMSKRRFLFN
jgi:tRNA A37 methylthiotransferase MiaB